MSVCLCPAGPAIDLGPVPPAWRAAAGLHPSLAAALAASWRRPGITLTIALADAERGVPPAVRATVFRAPRAAQGAGGAPRPLQTPDPDRAAVPNKRVLVVDDDRDVAEALADVLRDIGYAVDIASNGAVALERLQQQPYEVIVTDLRMPVLDGEGLYRALERQGHPALRRVVVVTGDEMNRSMRDFLDRTGVRYVVKPFTIQDVERIVARAAECA